MARGRFTRDHYIPTIFSDPEAMEKAKETGYEPTVINDDESSAVVYTYAYTKDYFIMMGFGGRRAKPDVHYRYDTEESMKNGVNRFIDGIRAAERAKQDRRKQNQERVLNVGDILVSSWGYDQTNIDYYQITKLVGNHSVELRPIGYASKEYDHFMQGRVKPAPNVFTGPPMKKRDMGGRVKVGYNQWASKTSPESEHRFSEYA